MSGLNEAITTGVARAVYAHRHGSPAAVRMEDPDLPRKQMTGYMPISYDQAASISMRRKLDRMTLLLVLQTVIIVLDRVLN